ncbi:MAG TPA: protein kinase [Kofleriaceae bacterium]|nr:protein kinase [Kofleriaceae bacterium]
MADGSDEPVDTRLDRPSRPSLKQPAALPDFGPRYRVIGPLGKGGMGEVFRAYDAELKGEVALKVIRGDVDLEAALARFRREIALARKVTSPNVLRVYDLAEHDGLRFVSMELVDGEDLGAVMKRDKRLPIERALAIFRQVCTGLVAAHAEGVVHRDLKPQNVLVGKDDRVRVADFGLARSIGDSGMTASGAILGSPAYMSPEQVKGDPTDERSDIYSLGVMLYQLVTGEAPFRGDTPHAVMEMRLHKKPRPLAEVAPDAPAYLAPIVARCLEVEPGKRYASVRALLDDLDAGRAPTRVATRRPWWLPHVLVCGIALVGAAIAYLAWPRGQREQSAPAAGSMPMPAPMNAGPTSGMTTVLVAGIDNRTGDPTFDRTLDVLVEYTLRRSSDADPIPVSEVRALATELGLDSPSDAGFGARVAARDGGRVVTVRGSIAAKGSGFEIALAANDARGGKVFADTAMASSLSQVVPTMVNLVAGLRAALGETLTERERHKIPLSASIEADHEFAVGYAVADANDDVAARAHLARAVALDPTFALAHIKLGVEYLNSLRPVEASGEFQRVLASLDSLGERDRLKFLGDYYRTVTEEYDRSIAAYHQLLAKWPKDLGAECNLAIAFQGSGDFKSSVEAGRRAARDHPHDNVTRFNLPVDELVAGNYQRATDELQRYEADFSRAYPMLHLYRAIASLFLGRRADAVDAYDKYIQADPSAGAIAKADFAMAEGRDREAAALLDNALVEDTAHHRDDAVEIEREMLAELRLRRADNAGARAAAVQVKAQPLRRLEAALVSIAVGDDTHAHATSAEFARDLAPSRRAMSKLIEAELLRVHGKPEDAVLAIQDALRTTDSALGHFLLARAALDAKAYTEAYSELQTCLARAADASFDVNDVPTYRYVPQFTYYLAKAQDGLGSKDAKATYAAFLAMMHDPDPDDPLVVDARKHAQ